MVTKRPETTGSRSASAASKVLRDPHSSSTQKSAAGSTLTQVRARNEETRAAAASNASKVLRDPNASAAAKSAAGSALTQVPPKKP